MEAVSRPVSFFLRVSLMCLGFHVINPVLDTSGESHVFLLVSPGYEDATLQHLKYHYLNQSICQL